jgi:hypothetical protein
VAGFVTVRVLTLSLIKEFIYGILLFEAYSWLSLQASDYFSQVVSLVTFLTFILAKLIVITGIPRFTSLICSSKTARRAKIRKTKIHFPLLPDGLREEGARKGRKLARKLKKRY